MRTNIFIILLLFGLFAIANAQSPLSIRLHKGAGQDATVMDIYANQHMASDGDLAGVAWSISGISYKCRGFFKFDLVFIPQGTLIDSAKLTLYGNPSPQHSPGHSSYSGSNASYLKRVTMDWFDTSITWSNQPASTTQNQIILPQSVSSMQDYSGIDVTTAIRDMINNPAANFGFVIQLQTEMQYRSLDFASGDCTDSTKWPKLDIYLTLVGVKRISNEMPLQFNLYQNYPNPFNPTTNIRYDVPVNSNIKLVVYDMLGKEVTALVNEKQEAGIYDIQWDASKYSSGLYFYKLETGTYSETKKLILLK